MGSPSILAYVGKAAENVGIWPPSIKSKHMRPFYGFIAASPYAVAPERMDDWLQLNTGFSPLVSFEDSMDIRFGLNPEKREIRVSARALERLWAHCSASMHLWDRVQQRHGRNVDLRSSPDSQKAFDLLAWAIEQEKSKTYRAPPSGVLRPNLSAPKGSWEYCANEMFLVVVGYILHHEIGHLVLQHSAVIDAATSIQQEREADRYAAAWLLDRLPDARDKRFIKRSLGIAIALSSMASLFVYGMRTAGKHPEGWDRLYSTLNEFVVDPEHPAWWMAMIILNLHMQTVGMDIDLDAVYDDPKACVDYLVDELSRFDNRKLS